MRTRSLTVALLLVLSSLAASEALGQETLTPAEARQKLEALGFVKQHAITADDFIDQVGAGSLDVVKLFLAAGMPPDADDARHRRALLVAAAEGHADVVRVLVEAGADVSVKDKVGRTPLVVAVWREHDEVVQVLTEAASRKQ